MYGLESCRRKRAESTAVHCKPSEVSSKYGTFRQDSCPHDCASHVTNPIAVAVSARSRSISRLRLRLRSESETRATRRWRLAHSAPPRPVRSLSRSRFSTARCTHECISSPVSALSSVRCPVSGDRSITIFHTPPLTHETRQASAITRLPALTTRHPCQPDSPRGRQQ